MNRLRAALGFVALIAISGCFTSKGGAGFDPAKVNSFKVVVQSGALGTPDAPLAYTGSSRNFTLQVTALNSFGQTVTNFAGPVTVSAVPGTVFGSNTVVFANGVGTGTVQLRKAFGRTRIWVEDPASYATGLSDTIYIRGLTIFDIRNSPNTVDVPFNLQRVVIDTASRLVVTGVDSTGFYVTDVDSPGGKFGSIYAFSFHQPQGISPGDRITRLIGSEFDFLGEAQIDNPTWNSTGLALPVPANQMLTCPQITGPSPNLAMAQYMGGRVEVDNFKVEVCGTYPACPSYSLYNEWVATLDSDPNCALDVVSNITLNGFDPLQNVGKVFTRLQGELGFVQYSSPQWFILPQGPQDVCCPTCTPALTQGC